MTREVLIRTIFEKKSFLCVGLDPVLDKLPKHLLDLDDPIFEFNKQIIDATHDLCIAYKPNIAFYECLGPQGWASLKRTIDYIGHNHFVIADAKRGDIGNTALRYAETFYETYHADAVTVAPYMGEDAISPFLQADGHWAVVLALTSNPGSQNFQHLSTTQGPIYQQVLRQVSQWGTVDNLMFVVGATQAELLNEIRKIIPQHFLLIPGVGAQGGSLQEVVRHGFVPDQCGLLINSSRGIIYAGQGTDFAQRSRHVALELQSQMESFLK